MKTGEPAGSNAKANDSSRAMYANETPARARNRSRLPSKNDSHAIGNDATSRAASPRADPISVLRTTACGIDPPPGRASVDAFLFREDADRGCSH
jgi:hypothetical protein